MDEEVNYQQQILNQDNDRNISFKKISFFVIIALGIIILISFLFWSYTIKKNKQLLIDCNSLEDLEKNKCYYEKIIEGVEMKNCNVIERPISKELCYLTAAKRKSSCENVPEEYLDVCFGWVEENFKDCKDITCKAIVNKNKSICDEIGDEDNKINCIVRYSFLEAIEMEINENG